MIEGQSIWKFTIFDIMYIFSSESIVCNNSLHHFIPCREDTLFNGIYVLPKTLMHGRLWPMDIKRYAITLLLDN